MTTALLPDPATLTAALSDLAADLAQVLLWSLASHDPAPLECERLRRALAAAQRRLVELVQTHGGS